MQPNPGAGLLYLSVLAQIIVRLKKFADHIGLPRKMVFCGTDFARFMAMLWDMMQVFAVRIFRVAKNCVKRVAHRSTKRTNKLLHTTRRSVFLWFSVHWWRVYELDGSAYSPSEQFDKKVQFFGALLAT